MPHVLAVRRTSRGDVRVRLDDGRTLAVPEEAWQQLCLSVPGPIEPELLKSLERAEQVARLWQRALRLLAVRPRSREEVVRRLSGRADPDVIAHVVGELERRGLVDDLRFARQWARARRESRGLGAARLRYELLRKGVDREVAEQAVAEAAADDESLAVEVARRRLVRYLRLPPAVAARRLWGYLVRRGFTPAAVHRALRAVGLSEAQDPGGTP